MGLSHFILRRNTLKIPKGQSESENTMKKKAQHDKQQSTRHSKEKIEEHEPH